MNSEEENFSLNLSADEISQEERTLSTSLAHRESTLNNSTNDQDDDLDSTLEEQTSKKKGRGKERQYEQIEIFPDYITANEIMTTRYTSYHYRYDKKTASQGDKSYYSCNNNPKCRKMMYILKVNAFNY